MCQPAGSSAGQRGEDRRPLGGLDQPASEPRSRKTSSRGLGGKKLLDAASPTGPAWAMRLGIHAALRAVVMSADAFSSMDARPRHAPRPRHHQGPPPTVEHRPGFKGSERPGAEGTGTGTSTKKCSRRQRDAPRPGAKFPSLTEGPKTARVGKVKPAPAD